MKLVHSKCELFFGYIKLSIFQFVILIATLEFSLLILIYLPIFFALFFILIVGREITIMRAKEERRHEYVQKWKKKKIQIWSKKISRVNSNYRKIRSYVVVKGSIEKRPIWKLLNYWKRIICSVLLRIKGWLFYVRVPISLWPMLGKESRFFYTRQ